MAIKKHKPVVDAAIRLQENKRQPSKTASRRCALCSTKKKPVRIVWKVRTFKAALCLKTKNCFHEYHSD
ncbi:hypothetical protein X975_26909, partial [Stegodyphus mimosarum]